MTERQPGDAALDALAFETRAIHAGQEPDPAQIVSSPRPPSIVSSPLLPMITSFLSLPTMKTGPFSCEASRPTVDSRPLHELPNDWPGGAPMIISPAM